MNFSKKEIRRDGYEIDRYEVSFALMKGETCEYSALEGEG